MVRPYVPLNTHDIQPRDSSSLQASSIPVTVTTVIPPLGKLSIRETATVAAWWSAVWFIANWAVNASLAWTSVASVTILSSTSGRSKSFRSLLAVPG
jgi:hypothetical protein